MDVKNGFHSQEKFQEKLLNYDQKILKNEENSEKEFFMGEYLENMKYEKENIKYNELKMSKYYFFKFSDNFQGKKIKLLLKLKLIAEKPMKYAIYMKEDDIRDTFQKEKLLHFLQTKFIKRESEEKK